MLKNIKTKPMLYVHFFQRLQQVAANRGYELLLHGSLNRDCDIVAVPWDEDACSHFNLLNELCHTLTGQYQDTYNSKLVGKRCHYQIVLNEATAMYLDIVIY